MVQPLPGYQRLQQHDDLKVRAEAARDRLEDCCLCPRRCRVNRSAGETGYCRTGADAEVAGYDAHFGEETPLVGRHGSGTIFFSHCNLLCNFCQNYDISHRGAGRKVTDSELADIMLSLQSGGCHNINFVTPSHVVPQILSALVIAAEKGLKIPLVFNSSAYDLVGTLQMLDGVVDIYMPDFKFWDAGVAETTCQAPDYPEIARKALAEMHRQVGDLRVDENGLAFKGLLVRHLVLPRGMAGTEAVMSFIARHISPDTYVNIMAQYRPCGEAAQIEALNRAITPREYESALRAAAKSGIHRLDPPRRTFALF